MTGPKRNRMRVRCFRLLTRLETLLCPPGQYQTVVDFSLRELDYASRPDPVRCYAVDTFRHLRRHGALPLLGAILVGLGTALYAFVNASLPQDVAWPAAGLGLIAGLPVIIPKVAPVRDGCPYLLDEQAPPAIPRGIHPRRTAFVGLLVGLTALAMPLRHLLFDVPAFVGVLVSGIGITVLALASHRRDRGILTLALGITALGALLVGFGDGGWGIVDASRPADAVASIVTGLGGVIYAASIGDLIRCFIPASGTPGQAEAARQFPGIDEEAA